MGEPAVLPDGRVYGTAKGATDSSQIIWRWDPATRQYSFVQSTNVGRNAYGGLTYWHRELHGMTSP